jgi:L-ascorbate metabolism protein UlaG (beta-lactamase superfamily)
LPESKSRRRWLAAGAGVTALGAGLAYRRSPFLVDLLLNGFGRDVPPAPARPHPRAWPERGIHAAWIGHSTVWLKIDGFSILTDPVFSRRIGLDFGLFTFGPKRLIEPALAAAELPRPDLILLSHAHMDHFDLPSLRALEHRQTQVVTARATSDLLRPGGYAQVTELGWGEHTQTGPARISAFEVNHWGARMQSDTYRGYNGYLIEVGRRRVIFAGDTALTPHFRGLGGADLALMPVGAYNPWIHAHCSPEQSWRMANDARADRVLAIHHRTFFLSREPAEEPLARLLDAAGASAGERVVARTVGAEFHLA